MRPAAKRARVLAAVCCAAALIVYAAWPYVASAALLFDVSGAASSIRPLLPARVQAVRVHDVAVPTRHGSVAARMYGADAVTSRAIVVIPGIHAGGVDEPRLDGLSRRLAGAGATVLSVPLPDLRGYRIAPRATDMIEDAVLWLAGRDPNNWTRVGLMGVSFSGGLAIVAAGRSQLQGKLTAVVSLGGHGDLPRALRALCAGELPDGQRPHDYGLAVMLRTASSDLVPANQAEAFDRALVAFLDGSSLADADPAGAAALLDESRAMADVLPEPGKSIMSWVHERNVFELGSRLLPLVEQFAGDPALSPERSPVPSAPVFLVHGRDDNVIPSSETPLLAAYLARQGATQVRWLLTPLVSHADVRPEATWLDQWRLVSLWTAIWRNFDD